MSEPSDNNKISGDVSLLKIMQRRLFIFNFLFSLLAIAVFVFIYEQFSRKSNLGLLRGKMIDVTSYYDASKRNLLTLTTEIGQNTLVKTRILAQTIQVDPSVLEHPEKFDELRTLLNVDEIHVSDENGILIASSPRLKQYIGYDMNSSIQSRAFLPALTDRNFEYTQPPQLNGANQSVMQYCGVARQDKPGIVQVGYSSERLKYMAKISEDAFITSDFRVGRSGGVYITKCNVGELADQKHFAYEIKNNRAGVKCAFLTAYHQGNRFEVWVPLQELEQFSTLAMVVFVLALLLFLIFNYLLVNKIFYRAVIRRIDSINWALQRVEDGELDRRLPSALSVEFSDMSLRINRLVSMLKSSKDTETRKNSMDLAIGHDFQALVLPAGHLKNNRFEINGWQIHSSSYGKDYYDYFRLSDDLLALVISDTSSERLPGVMLMMASRIFLRDALFLEKDPAAALRKYNNILSGINRTKAYVSTFVAVVDLKEEKLIYTSAGHNPQMIKRLGHPWEYLTTSAALPLGVRPDVPYENTVISFHPGDRLFLYTDGVVATRNPSGDTFGSMRLLEELERNSKGTAEGALKEIYNKMIFFTETGMQDDDVTMVAFEFLKQNNE